MMMMMMMMMKSVEESVDENWQGKLKNSKKTCTNSQHKSNMNCLVSNADCRLSYGTA
jgi:hypothetical protein